MTAEAISQAIRRVRTVLSRRPKAAIHDDDPAVARWQHDVRVVCHHENGTQIATDLPAELGGTGDKVTPGWLLRAALASCLASRIAMEAAAGRIALTKLEVLATSTSDARGMLGMTSAVGEQITAGPCEVRLTVRISAPDVPRERVRTLIDESHRCSPVSAALGNMVPIILQIEIEPS
jgi:uncharacterized OsmC-like protein